MKIGLKIFKGLGARGLLKFISSKKYIEIFWLLKYGKKIDLKNPKTFNEKMQWLKLYDHKKEYCTMVDKSLAKEFVAKKIGNEYIIKTLWEGENPKDIPYDNLPEQYVIKCTHGSHCSIIVKDRKTINTKKINKQLKKWLKRNWFWYGREWVYKDLKPKIIVEEYMEDNAAKELIDYKFDCFNGKPMIIDVCSKRYNETEKMCENFYDVEWNLLPFKTKGLNINKSLNPPKNLNKMLEISKKLSKNLKYVRVDLYEINNKIYFGELTFYSANGYEEWEPEEWNLKVGEYINIEK